MSGRERMEQGADADAQAGATSVELTPEERTFLAYLAELATASLQVHGAGSVAPEAGRKKE